MSGEGEAQRQKRGKKYTSPPSPLPTPREKKKYRPNYGPSIKLWAEHLSRRYKEWEEEEYKIKKINYWRKKIITLKMMAAKGRK